MPSAATAAPRFALTRTSARLVRAVAAERRVLERRRGQLARKRERVLAQLEPIDRALAEIDERVALLQRLAGDLPTGNGTVNALSVARAGGKRLFGAAIRETAVRTVRSQPQAVEALHYRDWYELVRRAGYVIAGSDPLAVFLTQLTRSPVVQRSTQPGVYALDLAAPQRLRGELDRLKRELREAATAESHGADLGSVRARRRKLQLSIDRHEQALDEALRALTPGPNERPSPTPGRPGAGTTDRALGNRGEERADAQS
jgi:hypothetical protein